MEIENDYKQLNWLRLKQEAYRLGNRYEPKWVWHSRERQITFAFRKLPRRIYFKCDAYEMIRNPNAGVNIYFSKSSLSSFWAVVLSPGQHRQFPQAIFLAVQFNNRWVWNQRDKEIAKVIFGSEHRHSTHALKPPMLIRHEKKKIHSSLSCARFLTSFVRLRWPHSYLALYNARSTETKCRTTLNHFYLCQWISKSVISTCRNIQLQT